MNSNRPIGIFDSGVGGLTVVHHFQKLLPYENIIYFGDTARVPYGTKAAETIKKFSLEIADFLVNKNVKCIVVACNSASAHAIHAIRQKYPDLPVYGMIESGSEYALLKSENKKIGIIGTTATIKSRSYEITIKNLDPNSQVESIACPLFVPFVEENLYDDNLITPIIEYYLKDFSHFHLDTLVLGCTHYPFLKERISNFFNKKIMLVDSGEAAANYVVGHIGNPHHVKPFMEPFYHCYLTSVTNKFFLIAKNCLVKPFNEISYVDIDH